jgi:formylglycine-generating enzyme required for sulfatase activity/tRNA A-37 threonylcarbamoyl transferase component Bud32
MVWAPGKRLYGDRYTIERKLGEGGFGITYLAKKHNGKRVAIKTLKDELLSHQDFPIFCNRFRDEALSLSLCRHDNIVQIDNAFSEGDLPCIAMEYVEGEDLATRVENRGILSEVEALQYIQQIGEALAYMHSEKGLLHRDVKPANIILRSGTSQVVLIDFGIARGFIPDVTQHITPFHTPAFSPPEQFMPEGRPGEYTDVYSLAATLYYLLTKTLPTPAPWRALNTPLKPPFELNPHISNAVDNAIIHGMEMEVRNRPQSVKQWLAMLPLKATSQSSLPTFQVEVVTVNAKGNAIKRERRQAEFFSADLGRGVMLEMVSIPGGTFQMGSSESSSEQPVHQVTVKPFFMSKYPITQAQWQAVKGNNPSSFPGAKRPVENVSWQDAVEFCAKLSRKTGKNYRLPSEAEWEYACRAGTTTPFHFGETITPKLVNYNGNYPYASAPKGLYRRETTPVGSFPPNAFKLYDMHGNVWEWCQDIWHDNYNGAPADGSAWETGESDYRVLRGGSWGSNAVFCRCANRSRLTLDYRYRYCGFRVAVSLSPGK